MEAGPSWTPQHNRQCALNRFENRKPSTQLVSIETCQHIELLVATQDGLGFDPKLGENLVLFHLTVKGHVFGGATQDLGLTLFLESAAQLRLQIGRLAGASKGTGLFTELCILLVDSGPLLELSNVLLLGLWATRNPACINMLSNPAL